MLCLAAVVISANFVFGQPYYFTHYQVENGLSNNAVLCSLQDHQGFMWFGTRDGLNRFDGLSFKVFRNDPDNKTSIGSNSLQCLYEDVNNRIWAGTEKGIFRYDEQTEKFSQLKVAGDLSIRNIKVTGSDIWYISLYTLYRYNEKTGKLKTFRTGREITSYCLMKDNTLWVSTSAGTIARYDDAADTFTEYNLFTRSPYAVSRWIESVFDTGTGILLIGTSNQGLKSFDTRSCSYKDVITLNTDRTELIVREMIAATGDEYWIATQSGIYILNLSSGAYRHLVKEQNDPYSLSDNIVHTLCRDKEGGIWAGTYFGGINYYPKQYMTIKKYFPRSGFNSISGNAVREICPDKNGNLWIGTEDAGLNKFNPVTGECKNFNAGTGSQRVSYSNIHSLLMRDNEIWVGTYLHGLDVLNTRTEKRIRHYNTGNSSIGSNFIYSIFRTSTGLVIVATDKGLYQYEPEKDDFTLISFFPKVFYRTLYEDKTGTIWAGTYGDGVYYYNTSGSYGQFKSQPNNRFSLPSNLINKIFEDSDGNMWFATEGGLSEFNKQSKRFESFTTRTGFPSDVTYAILQDGKKNLWVSTSKGLVCFSPASRKIKVYTKSHGLLTDQFNYSSGYKDGNGQMYFGSVKGLITFYPDSIRKDVFSPPVFLTGFQIHNKELPIDGNGSPLKSSITSAKSITLSHSQSTFSIDFAALSYTAPDMTRYAYKMEGLDKEWTALKTNRKVYFTELNTGTYTFKVKALNDNTGEYGNPAVLQISILPPVWKTWWAFAVYIISCMSIAYLVIQHFINRAKEKNKRILEKLEYDRERENYKDKFEFFTNVAHEIRTPLTLIKGPMENIMERADEIPSIKGSLEIMNRNTDRLLHLSSQLLDFRKIEMNGFRLSFAREDISAMLLDHYAGFKAIAKKKQLNMTVDFPSFFYAFTDAEALNKIISNLWDNALKYSRSTVHVSLAAVPGDGDTYSIIFKNDGLLIPPESREMIFKSFYRAKEAVKLPGTGIGLTLSRSLAEMHGGTLQLDPTHENINVFILTLPTNPKQA